MTRDELIEAMARAMCVAGGISPNADGGDRWRIAIPQAEAAFSVLLPLLKRAGESLGDIVRFDADPEGFGLADCIDNDGKAYASEELAGLLRTASAVHSDIRGMIDGR